jgi:hypothetical protein
MRPGDRPRLQFRTSKDLQSLTELGDEPGSITFSLIRHARDGVRVTCEREGLGPESWEGASLWFRALGDQGEASRAQKIRRSLNALRVRGRPRTIDSDRVVALRAQGHTWRAIATEMRISVRSARRAIERSAASSLPPTAIGTLVADSPAGRREGQP